jgi:subtilisin family serine protease
MMISALVLFAAAALTSPIQKTSTHCGTVDVDLGAGLTDRQLLGCGPSYSDNVLWNLDRSDGVQDDVYTHAATGKGAVVYVIDTGVQKAHDEFQREGGSNVIAGIDTDVARGATKLPCPDDGPTSPCNTFAISLITHGTAVASVVAGRNAGIAPDASIVAVRILGGANLAFEWALDDIVKHAFAEGTPPFRTAIVNMSDTLATPDATFVAKMTLMINGVDADFHADPNGKKFLFVTIAGNRNNNTDQCGKQGEVVFPIASLGASLDGLITVGGVSRDNHFWSGSCGGESIDILAPAEHVLTASITGHDHYRATITSKGVVYDFDSGTSYAAPYVCGIAARLLELDPTLTPAELETRIKASGSYVADAATAPAGGRVAVLIETPPAPPGPRRRAAGH